MIELLKFTSSIVCSIFVTSFVAIVQGMLLLFIRGERFVPDRPSLFSGWKTGWAYGPANLLKPLQLVHQNCVYTCPTPIQEAIAIGLEIETAKIGQNDSYWKELAEELEPKRDRICKFLQSVGMKPTVPEGGYFLIADYTQFGKLRIAVDCFQKY